MTPPRMDTIDKVEPLKESAERLIEEERQRHRERRKALGQETAHNDPSFDPKKVKADFDELMKETAKGMPKRNIKGQAKPLKPPKQEL